MLLNYARKFLLFLSTESRPRRCLNDDQLRAVGCLKYYLRPYQFLIDAHLYGLFFRHEGRASSTSQSHS